MINFPPFRFPYNYYYPYYNNNYMKRNKELLSEKKDNNNIKIEEKKYINEDTQENVNQKRSSNYNSFGPIHFLNPFEENISSDNPILEVLGIKLYLDDLILLGLLFLLYIEDVHDEMLFLALILLLLT